MIEWMIWLPSNINSNNNHEFHLRGQINHHNKDLLTIIIITVVEHLFEDLWKR
jgi:hypothetical protein